MAFKKIHRAFDAVEILVLEQVPVQQTFLAKKT
jgi:hypothetical protein